jgi:hypothetical protein
MRRAERILAMVRQSPALVNQAIAPRKQNRTLAPP